MRSVRVKGAELGFVTEGTATGLLHVLSIGSPTYYRRVYSDALRDQLQITFADVRHWVPTLDGLDPTTITLDTYAEDIDAVRQAAVGDEPVVVIGHSIHGALAIEYARRYPRSVLGAAAVAAPSAATPVLAEAGATFWEADATPERKAAHERHLATGRMPTAFETGQDLVDLYVTNGATYWYDAEYDASPLWAGVEANIPVFMQLMYGMFGDWKLEPIEVPTFVALGRYDYVVPYASWDDAKGVLSPLRLEVYERSGHTPQLEQPAEFDNDLLEWVKGLG